ncbi:MAG: calcium-binding protein, partial [Alphaproteobacteria bacterium]
MPEGILLNLGDNDDLAAGGNFDDTIDGGNGNDSIAGLGGDDSLLGGADNDFIRGDSFAGAAFGADTILGGNGLDTLLGGEGNDSILGEDGADLILGEEGADTLSGGNGADSVSGGNGADCVSGNEGTDTLLGGDGDDSLSGGGDNDSVLGEVGNDSLGGGDGSDSVLGGDGADTIGSGNDADSILGEGGSDSLFGTDGSDTVLGGDGGDTIYGGAGADSISGDNGDDRIYGDAGNDTIDAGSGTNDRVLYSHTGGPAITATITHNGSSSGVNRATVTSTDGTDSIQGFEVLVGSATGDQITVNSAATANSNLFLFGNGGNDTIISTISDFAVYADYNSPVATTTGVLVDLAAGVASDGQGGTDSLVGVTGVSGSSFGDTLLGSAANDRFRPYGGDDSIDGRGGTGDLLDFSSNTSAQAISVNLAEGRASDGFGGTDTLVGIEQVRGGSGNDTIIGDGLDNLVRGNSGSDNLDGGAGSGDVLDYSNIGAGVSVNLAAGRASDGANGTDTIAGFERVWGGSAGDTLNGSAGDDVLRGNAGSDSMDGGAGNADAADFRNATTGITVDLATGIAQDGQGGTDTLVGIERIWG